MMKTIFDERCVRLEHDEAVAVLTLNEPDALNPFTYRLLPCSGSMSPRANTASDDSAKRQRAAP